MNKYLTLLAALAAAPLYAAAIPPELTFNNAPIEALCFEKVSADEWVDLGSCVSKEIEKLPANPADTWTADKIGYHYRYKEDASDAVSYSYYHYIGQWNGTPVVVSYGSGGGTGQFSSLMSIDRNANKVRVLQGFAAGDRCNGGVVNARIEWGTLHYGQHMTPIDFLQIAEDNPNDVQPYEDLEASATSCYGVAHFEDEKFTGVTLQDIPADTPENATMYKYQPCFNRLYRGLLSAGKKELSVTELNEFTGQFNQVCLQHDPNERTEP